MCNEVPPGAAEQLATRGYPCCKRDRGCPLLLPCPDDPDRGPVSQPRRKSITLTLLPRWCERGRAWFQEISDQPRDPACPARVFRFQEEVLVSVVACVCTTNFRRGVNHVATPTVEHRQIAPQ